MKRPSSRRLSAAELQREAMAAARAAADSRRDVIDRLQNHYRELTGDIFQAGQFEVTDTSAQDVNFSQEPMSRDR